MLPNNLSRPPKASLDRQGWSIRGNWADFALVPLSVLVFFFHFRPWGGGLVEEWDFSYFYQVFGVWGTIRRHASFLGRPIATPLNVGGFALSDGAFWGPFLLLSLIAVLRLLAGYWALRPVIASDWMRLALATAIGLQPLWDAGLQLRFTNNHFAVLLLVFWVGALVRWLQRGQRCWLVATFLCPLVALLSYQGTTLAIALGALALVVAVPSTQRRQWAALVASGLGVSVAMAWSIVLAPLIVGGGYMADAASNEAGIVDSLSLAFGQIARFVPGILGMLVLLLAVVIYLAARNVISPLTTAALVFTIATTPLTALVFISDYGWMQDPERTSIPMSTSIWFVSCAIAAICFHPNRRPNYVAESQKWTTRQNVAAGAIIATSIIVSLVNYNVFASFERSNQLLLSELTRVLSRTPITAPERGGVTCFPESRQLCNVVVVDDSGEYGQIYTLGFPSLTAAGRTLFQPMNPGITGVTMCTPGPVLHERRSALATAGLIHQRDWIRNDACEELLAGYPVEEVASFQLPNEASFRVLVITNEDTSLWPSNIVTPANPEILTNVYETDYWWRVVDDPETFRIGNSQTEFAGVRFEVWAPACAASGFELTVTAGAHTDTFEVALAQADRSTLEVAFDGAVTSAELTITPHTPACQVPGDSRFFGPALANPLLILPE